MRLIAYFSNYISENKKYCVLQFTTIAFSIAGMKEAKLHLSNFHNNKQ